MQDVEAASAPIHRLTVEDVLRMVETEILDPDQRVELVDGILLDVSPAGEPHSVVVARLTRHFARADTERWEVRVQDTLYVPRGFRSPDLMLVTTDPARERLSSALLVVEVSRTSRARDEEKAVDYAQAGVPEYWRIDLDAREVVVRRDPDGDAYRDVRVARPEETLAPLADAPALVLATLLPPPD